MGYSTQEIDIDSALYFCKKDGEVISASELEYFNNLNWIKNIARAEKKDDGKTIFFTLKNFDFVEFKNKS